MIKVCNTWVNCDILWKNANWKWEECRLIDEILAGNLPGVPGELAQPPWLQEDEPYNAYNKEKRKRFIHLLCKIKGGSEFDGKKEIKENVKISLDDIKLVVNTLRGVDVEIFEE